MALNTHNTARPDPARRRRTGAGEGGNVLLSAVIAIGVVGALAAATVARFGARFGLERSRANKELAGGLSDDGLALMSQYFESGAVAPDCYNNTGRFVPGPTATPGLRTTLFGAAPDRSPLVIRVCDPSNTALTPRWFYNQGGMAAAESHCAKVNIRVHLLQFDCNAGWAKLRSDATVTKWDPQAGANVNFTRQEFGRVKYSKPPPPVPGDAVTRVLLFGGFDGDQIIRLDWRAGTYINSPIRPKYYAANIQFRIWWKDGSVRDTPHYHGPGTHGPLPGNWSFVADSNPAETLMWRNNGGNARYFGIVPKVGTTSGFRFEDGCCGRPSWVHEEVDFGIVKGF